MNCIKETIEIIDKVVYDLLFRYKDVMPKRFGKLIANYYTDARIRKVYSSFIGIKMGEGTFANLGMKVVPNESDVCVLIGENVSIAPNVTFVCCSSANNGKEINEYPYVKNTLTKAGDILVEDEAWIGANVTILPGVKVGRCSVIGAGSIVMEDVMPYSIYAGAPARKIRDLITGKRCNLDSRQFITREPGKSL